MGAVAPSQPGRSRESPSCPIIRAMARSLLGWLAYPLMSGGALVFAVWALGRGWPFWSIGVAVVVVAQALAEGLEWTLPWSKGWRRSRGDFATDVWHTLVSNRGFDLGTVAALACFVPLGRELSARFGWVLWPHHWPVLAQGALALVVLDLPWYWVHRLSHAWPLLWRLHAVHHSVERMYWWNAARSHPLETILTSGLSMAPLAFLGVSDQALAIVAAFSGVHSALMHSNVDLRTGPLDIFLNTARVHRWHHSPRQHESFANFSPTVTIWDWVFGTRRFDPRATPGEDVGLGSSFEGPFPSGFLGQMRAPFEASLWRPPTVDQPKAASSS